VDVGVVADVADGRRILKSLFSEPVDRTRGGGEYVLDVDEALEERDGEMALLADSSLSGAGLGLEEDVLADIMSDSILLHARFSMSSGELAFASNCNRM
jgi:hypothetical protein